MYSSGLPMYLNFMYLHKALHQPVKKMENNWFFVLWIGSIFALCLWNKQPIQNWTIYLVDRGEPNNSFAEKPSRGKLEKATAMNHDGNFSDSQDRVPGLPMRQVHHRRWLTVTLTHSASSTTRSLLPPWQWGGSCPHRRRSRLGVRASLAVW